MDPTGNDGAPTGGPPQDMASSSVTAQGGAPAAAQYPGVFNFAAAEDDLFEVEVSEEPPGDDDDSTVYSEMDESDGGDEEFDGRGVPAGPDMAHAVMSNHGDAVYVSAIHPRNADIVVTGGGDDRAFLWKYDTSAVADVPTESRVLHCVELAGHTDTVTSVGFNFDGSLILTGAYDGTIRTWDAATGELRLVLDGPEDVEFAQWHTKGNAIMAGSKDGTIWMWLAHDGQCVQVFAGHEGAVTSGCFTSDGKLVCSGGEDGTVRVWAPKTGACKHVFNEHSGHMGLVTCMASHPTDGELLLTGSVDGTMRLYHLGGKRSLQIFIHCRPKSAADTAMKPIQEANAEGSDDEEALRLEQEETFSVECVGFATNGMRWVASGGLDSTLKVWDLDNGSLRCTCVHSSVVTHLQWHSVHPMVFTSTVGGSVCVWDARAGLQLSEFTGHRAQITHFSIRPVTTERGPMDAVVTAADDHTSRVFLVDSAGLL